MTATRTGLSSEPGAHRYDVIVNGQIVMENRVMQTVQLDEICQSVDEFEADIEFAKELLQEGD
ncbi:hypothetical protein OK016_29410 [Vibrio chagasii]|nr:hypothetical protein [Vibrio chagasii]